MNVPFTPYPSSCYLLDVTSTSKSFTITGDGRSLIVSNIGSKACYIVFGAGTQTAILPVADTAVGGMCIPAGKDFCIRRAKGQTTLAAICAGSDTTTLAVTPGEGGI